jgi:hypothetical protein
MRRSEVPSGSRVISHALIKNLVQFCPWLRGHLIFGGTAWIMRE